jgi:hypothetical protein
MTLKGVLAPSLIIMTVHVVLENIVTDTRPGIQSDLVQASNLQVEVGAYCIAS